jgi:hypothetical protein
LTKAGASAALARGLTWSNPLSRQCLLIYGMVKSMRAEDTSRGLSLSLISMSPSPYFATLGIEHAARHIGDTDNGDPPQTKAPRRVYPNSYTSVGLNSVRGGARMRLTCASWLVQAGRSSKIREHPCELLHVKFSYPQSPASSSPSRIDPVTHTLFITPLHCHPIACTTHLR